MVSGTSVFGFNPVPRIANRQFLVGKVDEASLVSPADMAGDPIRSTVSGSHKLVHLYCRGSSSRLQPEWDESLDDRHDRLNLLDVRGRSQSSESNVFDLAFALDSEYPFHEASPCCAELSVGGSNHPTIRESLRILNEVWVNPRAA